MVASLMAFGAAPAGAAIDTSDSCPDSIADAGFTDLAGVPAAAVDAINCIADYGISTGTTATTFDPFAEVARWQMALFITRQATAHGLGAALPAGTDQGFTDLGGVPAAAVTSINQIAELGISTGTSATTFDPFATVERWQMALFLQRLIVIAVSDNSPAVTLPDGSDQGFTDLAGVPAAAVTAINTIAQLDVADGTTATTFDPFAAVERWAMALFLARTLAADGIEPGVTPTGSSFNDMPELVSVSEVSFDDGDEELILMYTFDEDIDRIQNDDFFWVYEADGTPYDSSAAEIDGDEVTVLFTGIDEDTYDLLTVATVEQDAVEDEDGLNNPEGAIGLADATIEAEGGDLADLNLDDVRHKEVDVLAGTSIFLFEYDDDVSVADLTDDGLGDFLIVLDSDDGANPDVVACDYLADSAANPDLRDDQIAVECPAAITSGDWARGVDNDGLINGGVWQAADERSTDAPDLVSVEVVGDLRVEFTFDEQVSLFGGEDDSDDDPGTEANFLIYDEDGNVAFSTGRAIVTDSNRVVRVEFEADDVDGTLGIIGDGDDDLDDGDVEGGFIFFDAVEERSGNELGNAPDEARAGAGDDVDVDAGSTTDPDLLSASDIEVSSEDIEGDPDEWEIVFTFDEDLNEGDEGDGVCDPDDFYAYTDDGTIVQAVGCDSDGDETTVTFDDDDVEDAVSVGAAWGAVEADDNGDTNPEGYVAVGSS
jgi:hypothetical protein